MAESGRTRSRVGRLSGGWSKLSTTLSSKTLSQKDSTSTLGRSLAGVLAATIALTASGEETMPDPWYQVEIVLFENTSAAARTDERLGDETTARVPAASVAIGPAWPEDVSVERVAELAMLWDGVDAAPRLDVVTPGLDPETERLIRWLQRLNRRSGAPDLRWLRELSLLRVPVFEETPAPAPEPMSVDADRPALPDEGFPEAIAGEEPTAAPITTDDADAGRSEPIRIPIDMAFRSVPQEQRVLAEDAERLGRARDFRVLEHLAWRQPFEVGAEAVPVLVRWTDPTTGEAALVGSVGVALRRYLHVDFDLRWRVAAPEEADEGRDISAGADASGHPVRWWAPIRQSRRMRSEELHYVDHPRVGALVRITPFELTVPPEPEAIAPTGD